MKPWMRYAAAPAAAGVGLLAVSLYVRPLLPLDETRLASVAWEMWSRADYLVPHLNGVPYSHKPPLLYWLVMLCWRLTGVGGVAPRLVPALFGLASLFLTARLASRLWPGESEPGRIAPFILFGTSLFTALATLTAAFDALVTLFVLVGAAGILRAAQGKPRSGWLVTGLAIGFAILAKGPAVLVHLAPLALAAPWWAGGGVRERPGRWYAGVLLSLLLGAALALAWAIPAGQAGGAAYREEILWSQTARRVVDSFAHRHVWWFYLAFSPFVLAPWSFWPETWRQLARLAVGPVDRGVRFCVAWALPAPVLLSLASGKQAHYLLPVLPGFALLLARALARSSRVAERAARIPTALVVLTFGAIVTALAGGTLHGLPEWTTTIPIAAGVALVAVSVALLAFPCASLAGEARLLAGVSTVVLFVLHVEIFPSALAVLDLRRVAETLGRAEREGRPTAQVGGYDGQYHFLGRLRRPIDEVEPFETLAWAWQHPRGAIVLYERGPAVALTSGGPELVQPARGLQIEVWSSEALLAR